MMLEAAPQPQQTKLSVQQSDLTKALLVSMELGDIEFCVSTIEQSAAKSVPLAVQVDGAAIDMVLWVKTAAPILDGDHLGGWELDVAISDVVFQKEDRWLPDLNVGCRLVVLMDTDSGELLPEGYLISP
ncbi:hypothetical protein [Mycobacteroides abscessus]|uniref:hypothetical protein n=1 Tax=Mycobacteroides abscessus TaxID=36809 RepID=UPI0009A7B16F|nr:hypothetical protein [Mycobacteroides abscessus]SLH43953.1 Uncharacterised protein [Mycobacteroides abscessus subsp. massiliense]